MNLFSRKNKSNRCYTYFRIVGDFDPDELTRRLELTPYESWKTGDAGSDGSTHDFSAWHFGKCDAYSIDVSEQMMETLTPLLGKTDVLNQIREEKGVSFCLEIVPHLYPGNTTPSLAPSREVMTFCTATGTEIDVDLYVGK